MRTFGVGHDYGSSCTTVTAYMNGQEYMRTFPSVSAGGSLKQLAKIRRAAGNDTIVADYQALGQGEYVLHYDGTDYFVGSLAVAQGQGASSGRRDTHRYWSQRSLETLLTATADMIPDASYELLVVTGLPIETFSEETRKSVKSALNGTHHFALNGRERMAHIKVGKVLMEGAGASLNHESVDDEVYGVVDVGGRTIDLYVRRGFEAIVEKCRGKSDVGVESAADKISVWFEERYGFSLSLADRAKILLAFIGREKYPPIKVEGKVIPELDLVRWTRKAFSDVGRDITEFVSQIWHTGDTGRVAAEFGQVAIVGGGAYYFQDAIRTIISHAEVPLQPEHANARGYGRFAYELVQQRMSEAS